MGKDLFNDRISRFSIRKLNVGVCSVLLGTLVMVGTAASAAAEEKTDTTSENVAAVAPTSEAPAASTAAATSATSTTETTSTAATTYEANAPVTAPASTSAASSTSTAASAASTAPATSTAAATPSLEATTPTNKALEAASTTADKKEELASGVQATATDAPAVTAETSGGKRSSRTRRALGDANDPNLIGDDVVDATSSPKVEKPGFTTDVDAKSMTSQIAWLDFGDLA